jgi:hypothetical protein
MKVCERCGEEIGGKDGDNLCVECEKTDGRRRRATYLRRERDRVMRDLGLVKVHGALGGTYWE